MKSSFITEQEFPTREPYKWGSWKPNQWSIQRKEDDPDSDRQDFKIKNDNEA